MAAESLLLVAVALPVPMLTRFDYLASAEQAAQLLPGMRVRVPFGRRQLVGMVVGVARAGTSGDFNYRAVTAVLDAQPIVPAEWLSALQWAADYYLHPIGEVIAAGLPKALRDGEGDAAPPPDRSLHLTPSGAAALPALPRSAHRQRALLADLLSSPLPSSHAGHASAALRDAVQRGWAAWHATPAPVSPPLPSTKILTLAQADALLALQAGIGRFSVGLLQGVTGSGKTEIYLALAAEVVAKGQQVLVLVPEIGLTPQLLARFTERFGERVSSYHSGMSDRARRNAWLALRDGRAVVLVGTRSAVLLPFAKLGLVVVDEEHDVSYKQQDGFRYQARDVAVLRARNADAALVLGSATPSLESLANAQAGRYRLVVLGERIAATTALQPRLIDLNLYPARNGLSEPLALAIRRHVDAGGQVLIFINRRGYAPTLFCQRCHWTAPCPHCDARLTVHRSEGRLVCHHCGYSTVPAKACPSCSASPLVALGEGTERIEEALKNLLPGRRVERFDSERFNTAGQLQALLEDVRQHRVDVLVGTQMLAKGHDFGQLSLVGVVNVDQALFSADFRATERFGQLLTQVAGRAGRNAGSAAAAEVLIQTREPRHPVLQRLLTAGYAALAEQLLAERRSAGLPPYAHLALLRAESGSEAQTLEFLRAASALFPADTGVEVLGPITASMARRAGRFRAQLLLRAPQRQALRPPLAPWMTAVAQLPGARQIRFALDVDPVDLF